MLRALPASACALAPRPPPACAVSSVVLRLEHRTSNVPHQCANNSTRISPAPKNETSNCATTSVQQPGRNRPSFCAFTPLFFLQNRAKNSATRGDQLRFLYRAHGTCRKKINRPSPPRAASSKPKTHNALRQPIEPRNPRITPQSASNGGRRTTGKKLQLGKLTPLTPLTTDH